MYLLTLPSLVAAAAVLLHIWNLPTEMTIKQSCYSERCCSRSGIHSPVVLTLTHRYNAIRGHRTGSNNSRAEDYLKMKTNEKQKIIHRITETNRIPQRKIKR